MVLTLELLNKIKQIEIRSKKIVTEMMTGQYRSHFKGHGVQFSEHRLYQPGDDVRYMDWKASARSKESLIKKFEEEREMQVFLVADVSKSFQFGSSLKNKKEILAECVSVLAFAATLAGDRVGAIFFSGRVEKIIPPKKGRNHVLKIISDLFSLKTEDSGTSLKAALESVRRMMKHQGIVFILSDFMDDGYEKALLKLSKKNDVVCLWIQDDKEFSLKDIGEIFVGGFEDTEEGFLKSSSFSYKRKLSEEKNKYSNEILSIFKKNRIEFIQVKSNENYLDELVHFFRNRTFK